MKVNGMLTEEIKLEAGTRQGCPLSPTLFLLVMEILTKMIEKDEELEGYKGYKINLYADDTLIILKDIEKDLKKIHKHLKEFEEMTGLRVNWLKSELLMDNNGNERENMQEQFGIRIKNTLKYLGITLSLKVKEMKKLNYDVVMNEVEKKIDKYKMIKLSWFGRIAMCKMMLLPKFNFLFEMLPLNLTEKDIEGYQKKLDKFCNGGKRPRLVKKMWYQNQKEGGLGIPKLLNYYWAYGIRTVVKIFKGEDSHWRDLELKDIKRFGSTWFLDKAKSKCVINSYWLKGLSKIWNKFVKILIPDIIFLGKTIGNWPIKTNISRDKVIEDENIEIIIDWLKTLENERRKKEIIEKLGLGWFEKIQIEKWTKKVRENCMISRNKTEFEYLVSQIMKDEIGLKGLVSKIYKIINFDGKPQMVMKMNWEKELNIKISDLDWNVNWKSRIMKTLSVRIKEHNYKVVWKWYLTPLRLSLMDNKISKKCWRCDMELGTYEHMWYKCDKVKKFWQQLEKMIFEMMGKIIILRSETILLLIIKEIEPTKYEKELIRIMIIMGRIIIARYWKLDVNFRIEEWYCEMWKLALNDKMTCDIKIRNGNYKEDIFWKIWKPFVDYALGNLDASVPVPRERGFWRS